MENKYYTPTIEELHVGFVCELNIDYSENGIQFEKSHPNCWYEIKIDDFSEMDIIHLRIEGEDVRVKYLDKEDIDNLIQYEKEIIEFIEDNVYEFNYNKSGTQYRVFYTYSDRMISFYEIDHADKLECFFRGTIKNKSELKKLMQQLAIN